MSHGHEKADARNRALHRLALDALRRDPETSRRDVIALLDRWSAMPHLRRQVPLLEEWRRLLELPLAEIEGLILGDDGQQLRQCSPLGVLISPRERWAVYRNLAET